MGLSLCKDCYSVDICSSNLDIDTDSCDDYDYENEFISYYNIGRKSSYIINI